MPATNTGAESLNPPYQPGLYRFAMALSGCVFLLIVAGALVTSNNAGLAVPDWPTSFGSLYKIPPMVGGVKYEHGHRMVAQFCGLLTIVLAVWTHAKEPRAWMRKLGWGLVGLVIVQGVLGGLTVKMLLPWYVSTAHAMLGQTYFAATLLFATFCSRRWLEAAPANRSSHGLPALSWAALGCVYLQLFLGAAFRHGGMHFVWHLVGAGVATVIIFWAALLAVTRHADVRPIRAMGSAVLGLLVLQLILGFAAYITRVEWGKDAPQPLPSMVASTVAHVAIGALLLAHCALLAVQSYRHLALADRGRSRDKAVLA